MTEEQQLAAKMASTSRTFLCNLPITTRAPSWVQVEEFATLAENPVHYPILFHCVSANRSGAIWHFFRTNTGNQPIVAIEEGRAAGLESREIAVRKMLGL